MSDITKCKAEKYECIMRETCWRFTAPANPHRQAYFAELEELPGYHPDHGCDMYWETRKKK